MTRNIIIKSCKELNDNKRIYSVKDLETIIEEIRERFFLNDSVLLRFRGLGSIEHKLIATLFRNKFEGVFEDLEKKLLDEFIKNVEQKKIKNIRRTENRNEDSWNILFQARHLGLPTRTMDWTDDWKVALFFAVENQNNLDKDGVVWLFIIPSEIQVNGSEFKNISLEQSPFSFMKDNMLNPYNIFDEFSLNNSAERRKSRQRGYFWFQNINKAAIPLEEQKEYIPYLVRIIIDAKSKDSIKHELKNYPFTNENNEYYILKNYIPNTDEVINDIIKKCYSKL